MESNCAPLSPSPQRPRIGALFRVGPGRSLAGRVDRAPHLNLDARLKRLSASAQRIHFRWKIWLPVVLLFLTLDSSFNAFFWEIPRVRKTPNSHHRSTDRSYQIALDHHRLLQPKPADSARVLAFGSSISGSFDPHQVQSLVQAKRPLPQAEVHRLMVPGIHPPDYLLLFENEPMPLPDVTVILFNLVDFLYPAREHALNPWLLYFVPPMALWRARHDSLEVSDQLELGLSRLSNLFRYHKLIRSCLLDHLGASLRWLLSPAPPRSYGIYADGYTERRFALKLSGPVPIRFEYFVDPEWISQRGRVQLQFSSDGQPLTTRIESEAGWKTVELPLPSAPALVEVSADSVWNPRAGGATDDLRLLGVKLKELPVPNQIRAGVQPFRYQLADADDIRPVLRMKGKRGDDFDRAWDEQMQAKTRFGRDMRRFRDAKLALRDKPFVVGEGYLAIQKLVQLFRARGSKVVLVNTPDNPRLLGDYEKGPYYRGHLAFFRSLASASGADFYDLSASLPAEDFNDGHHVNYVGAIKLGRIFADMVERALPEVGDQGSGARVQGNRELEARASQRGLHEAAWPRRSTL